jgi:ABC-type molybdate transport system substrate-binding protein
MRGQKAISYGMCEALRCLDRGVKWEDQLVNRRAMIRAALAALTAIAFAGTAACGTDSKPTPASGSAGVTGPITVFAAASLTESFTQIGKDFEAANPGSKVTFNFAGSSALATQINQGAPADVFASASPTNMKTVTDAGSGLGTATVFVRNQLVIAVPKGNPKAITGLADLTKPGAQGGAVRRAGSVRRRGRQSIDRGQRQNHAGDARTRRQGGAVQSEAR